MYALDIYHVDLIVCAA